MGWCGFSGHVIAYAMPFAGKEGLRRRLPGTLDDYAFTVHACADAWFATGKMKFYRAAITLADAMIERFYDRDSGTFLDAAQSGAEHLGALTARRMPLQDTPTPAGNPTAASALLRLEALSGRADYRRIAKRRSARFPAWWAGSASMPGAMGWPSKGCCSIRCRWWWWARAPGRCVWRPGRGALRSQ